MPAKSRSQDPPPPNPFVGFPDPPQPADLRRVLGPRSKHFTVAIILGEKAVAALRESELAPEVIAMVEQAPKYTEGRVIRFEIRSKKEAEVVEALAKIKMDN